MGKDGVGNYPAFTIYRGRFTLYRGAFYSWACYSLQLGVVILLRFTLTFYLFLLGALPFTVGVSFIWKDLNLFRVGLRGNIGLEFRMRGRFKFWVSGAFYPRASAGMPGSSVFHSC